MLRLIACDMDGTLLDENKEIPHGTFELICELKAEGVRFCVSSGRPYQFLQSIFEPIVTEMDFVCSNGCNVVIQGKTVDRELHSHEALVRLKRLCDEFDSLHLVVYDEKGDAYLIDDPTKAARFEETIAKQWDVHPVLGELSPETTIMTGTIASDSDISIMDIAYLCNLEMGRDFTFAPVGSNSIDVMPAHVNKATGILQVMEYYKVSPRETIAYGDSMNDYDIFRLVGHPTAMANAGYAPKQVATRIIESHTEHGVLRDMQRLLDELRQGGDGSRTLRFGAKP